MYLESGESMLDRYRPKRGYPVVFLQDNRVGFIQRDEVDVERLLIARSSMIKPASATEMLAAS
jgi:hypothetical protein